MQNGDFTKLLKKNLPKFQRTLVLLGGPAGVGKTSVARSLRSKIGKHAWLDADWVMNIQPFEVTEDSKKTIERNIRLVLQGYLELHYPTVLLTWVLHRQDLIKRITLPLANYYERLIVLHLTATDEVIVQRLHLSNRDQQPIGKRIIEIEELPYPKIKTDSLSIEEVANEVWSYIKSPYLSKNTKLNH